MVCTRPGRDHAEPIPCTAGVVHTWFHVAMRLTVLEQYARGVAHHDEAEGTRLLRDLERTKWLLWHGNQHRAGQAIAFFEEDVDGLAVDYPNLGKFARAAHEFAVYLADNRGGLINYGERFRPSARPISALSRGGSGRPSPVRSTSSRSRQSGRSGS